MSHSSLFVWRGRVFFLPVVDGLLEDLYEGYQSRCLYCGSQYRREEPFEARLLDDKAMKERGFGIYHRASCGLCGFTYEKAYSWEGEDRGYYARDEGWAYTSIASLIEFDINDGQVALGELGTHLRRRAKDLDFLDSRRFEELVGDVFRSYGYRVRLTPRTRDGGYDLLLFESDRSQQILVECKRYSGSRRVGVTVVRELLGVQLQLGIPKAKIVATCEFTQPARSAADQVAKGSSGYQLELVDIHKLLRALGCYNEALPPLEEEFRLRGYLGS